METHFAYYKTLYEFLFYKLGGHTSFLSVPSPDYIQDISRRKPEDYWMLVFFYMK